MSSEIIKDGSPGLQGNDYTDKSICDQAPLSDQPGMRPANLLSFHLFVIKSWSFVDK